MKYWFIYENRSGFKLGKMCKVLEVSRSGYHKYLRSQMSQRRIENIQIAEEIKRIYKNKHGRYGSPRIYEEMRKDGKKINKKRIARLMRINKIRAITKRKYKATTNSAHYKPVAENLLNQKFKVAELNKIWVSDITYIWTKEGWLYLAIILDLYSRRIVGWSMSENISANMVSSAIGQALINRSPVEDMIFHSDRGSQYASEVVKSLLQQNKITPSMSGKGNCYDNAVAESFFHTLKVELIYTKTYATRDEAKNDIFEYIEIFYNRERRHSAIKYLSPVDFENRNIKLVA
jgi:putative transposase